MKAKDFLSNSGNAQEVSRPISRFGALASTLGQGLTAGFSDELQALIAAPIASVATGMPISDAYSSALELGRDEISRAREQYPVQSILSELAGGIGTGYGAGATLAARAPQAMSAMRTAATAMPKTTAAGLGAISGGLYGAGSSDGGIQNRGLGALGGAAGGAVAAPVAGYIGGQLGKLANYADDALGKLTGKISGETERKTLGQLIESQRASPNAMQNPQAIAKVRNVLKDDFGVDYEDALKAYEDGNISLMDLMGNKTRSLSEAAAMFPSGRAVSETKLYGKVGGIKTRIEDAITNNISSVDNFYTHADDLLAAGRAKAAPLYKEAFDGNKALSSPRLDNILTRPATKSAFREVVENTQNEMKLLSKPDPELTALNNELVQLGMMDKSQGGVAKGLNLRTLDAVKRNLDKKINILERMKERGLNFTPADDQQLGGLLTIKNALVEELDNLDTTGLYAKARAEAGDYLSINSIMKEGKDILRKDPELIAKRVSQLNPSEKNAYKIGIGKAVREKLSDTSDTRNVNMILNNQSKLKAALSDTEYQNLMQSVNDEKKLLDLTRRVLGGSDTARRETAKAMVNGIDIEDVRNVPKKTVNEALRRISIRYFGAIDDATSAKIADILYETDPTKKLKILNGLRSSNLPAEARKQSLELYAITRPRFDVLYAQGAGVTGSSNITQQAQE